MARRIALLRKTIESNQRDRHKHRKDEKLDAENLICLHGNRPQ